MLSDLFKIYAIKADPDDLAGSTILGGITNVQLGAGTQIRQEVTSGMMYGQFQELLSGEPRFSFSSYHLGRMLGICSFTGLRISAGTLTGMTFYAFAKQHGGGRKSGANHVSFNVKNGILYPRRIRIPFRGSAIIEYQGLITYDGTNMPFVMATGVAVPSNTIDDQRYGMGLVQIGTTADNFLLTGHTEVVIDFNVEATAEGSSGDVWPSFASIDKVIPRIRITTYDVHKLKSTAGVPLTGKQIDATKCIIFARKRVSVGAAAHNEQYVADGTAEHISFNPLAGCACHDDILTGTHEGHPTATITIEAMSDNGSNVPLAIDTTAAMASL